MTQAAPLWPLVLYAALVVVLVVCIVLTSFVLGQRHRQRTTHLPYESGIQPSGSARLRYSADFYLVAMFFVIFDIEAVFLYAWAVAAREAGWAGYVEVVVFIGILLAALAYLWRVGGLDWGSRARVRAAPRGGA